MEYIIDFETYSPIDIEAGVNKYASDPTADIVCLAYRPLTDTQSAKVWYPKSNIPLPITEEDVLYAHNAYFDYVIWSTLGPKYGFPNVPLASWRDTMALCTRYTLPGKLSEVGKALNLEVQKSRLGAALLKKICCPTVSGIRPILGVHYTYDELRGLYSYCQQDVDSTHDLLSHLPSSRLSPLEQQYWLLTQQINLKGLPVDSEAIEAIAAYIEVYAKEMSQQIPELTSGQVQKVTQVKKVTEFLQSLGVDCPNLQAETVNNLLEDEENPLPDVARTLLELRQILGRSSSAKFAALRLKMHEGRIHGNLQYYRAGTGRWGGRGFQPQNLPRLTLPQAMKLKDKLSLDELITLTDNTIECFKNAEPIEDALNISKALIRPMIKAPLGRKLIVRDYSSIENRVLHWYAEDEVTLQRFRNPKYDQYIDMSAFLFKKPESAIGKKSYERQVGKVIILGCGFVMGVDRFLAECQKYKIAMDRDGAVKAVQAYREKYPEVKRLWRKFYDAACDAINFPTHTFVVNKVAFAVRWDRNRVPWLAITLASGRVLYYCRPYVILGKYGPEIRHQGQHPKTHQWTDVPMSVSRVVENIVQGTARDVMAQGMLNVSQELPEVDLICTVHDEALGEADDTPRLPEVAERLEILLCRMPAWADGLPLRAEGYEAQRYRKD